MTPDFKTKLMVFVAVAFGTATTIFLTTHFMVGMLGVCR
jgi:hypothetical protein